jgi:uncharacterized membrane protein YqjE
MAAEYFSANVRGAPSDKESAAGLLSRLIGDASALVRNEVALAKTELTHAANNAKRGVAALAIASVIMLAGALSLIAALILALAQVIAPWAAALLVGVAFAIVGFIMFQAARSKLSATAKPLARTQSSLQQDAAVLARRAS